MSAEHKPHSSAGGAFDRYASEQIPEMVARIKELEEQLEAARSEIESLEGIERDRDMHADKATTYQTEYHDLDRFIRETIALWDAKGPLIASEELRERYENFTSNPATNPAGVPPGDRSPIGREAPGDDAGEPQVPSPASSLNAATNNRCDHPGCLSRVTATYLVGLGGMPAFYCADHAPASSSENSRVVNRTDFDNSEVVTTSAPDGPVLPVGTNTSGVVPGWVTPGASGAEDSSPASSPDSVKRHKITNEDEDRVVREALARLEGEEQSPASDPHWPDAEGNYELSPEQSPASEPGASE